jgi:hypothetical protein
LAASYGYEEMVSIMLDHDTDLHSVSNDNKAALHFAAILDI